MKTKKSGITNWEPADEQAEANLATVRGVCCNTARLSDFALAISAPEKRTLPPLRLRTFKSGLFLKQSELLRRLRQTYRDRAAIDPVDEAQNAVCLVLGWPPACTWSLDHANLLTGYELHHAPADELKANGGVCNACAAKIKKANAGVLVGKVEAPVDLNEKHGHLTLEQDHVAFTETSEIELVENFPFDDLDKDTAEFFANISPDGRSEAAMALSLILGWIWQSGFESAQRKFAAMSAGLRPDLLNDATYEEIGSKLGCVKATIAKAARNFQKQFNMKFSRSQQDAARAKMRARRLGGPDRHHQATKGAVLKGFRYPLLPCK